MLLDEFWLEFWGHWSHEILVVLVICDVVRRILVWILGALKLWSFGNVGNLWCLLDELWLEFWELWNCEKICCVGLVEQNHDECGRFVGMCKALFYGKILQVCALINLGVWANFVGIKLWLMEKFCWVCEVSSWKILWLWFYLYENLFVHGQELVGIFVWLFWTCRSFLCMVMENFGSCVWICEKFWLWWNFGGALIFCCGRALLFVMVGH